MQENNAPEKIHIIQPNAHDRWFEGKIPNGLPDGLFVEYTRTDAFIEKACEWLRENKDKYLYNTGSSSKGEYIPTCSGKMIDDFKKYMEE